MIAIYRGTYFEAMNMRNLLESNSIVVFTENENMATIEPWVVTAGGANPFVLKINDEDFVKAKEIIENFEKGNLNFEV